MMKKIADWKEHIEYENARFNSLETDREDVVNPTAPLESTILGTCISFRLYHGLGEMPDGEFFMLTNQKASLKRIERWNRLRHKLKRLEWRKMIDMEAITRGGARAKDWAKYMNFPVMTKEMAEFDFATALLRHDTGRRFARDFHIRQSRCFTKLSEMVSSSNDELKKERIAAERLRQEQRERERADAEARERARNSRITREPPRKKSKPSFDWDSMPIDSAPERRSQTTTTSTTTSTDDAYADEEEKDHRHGTEADTDSTPTEAYTPISDCSTDTTKAWSDKAKALGRAYNETGSISDASQQGQWKSGAAAHQDIVVRLEQMQQMKTTDFAKLNPNKRGAAKLGIGAAAVAKSQGALVVISKSAVAQAMDNKLDKRTQLFANIESTKPSKKGKYSGEQLEEVVKSAQSLDTVLSSYTFPLFP